MLCLLFISNSQYFDIIHQTKPLILNKIKVIAESIQIEKAFLLIPDISGFTHFVNNTEIIHGVHIISELLETIIDSNTIGLEVAEIEGDAVFFYRKGERPSAQEIYQQIEQMYIAFHQQLMLYERDRICSCGACSSVNNLKIKFISHYGDVVERTIYNHFQLMGSDVTMVHKLLKNNISEDEYLLFSENDQDKELNNLPYWVKFQSETSEYFGIGKVTYQFTSLKDLKKQIPEITPRRIFESIDNPVLASISINVNIKDAFTFLTDLDRKALWMNGLKKVKYKPERVDRIGTSHDCILPLNTLHFESIENTMSENKMIYSEFADTSIFFPAFYQRFILKKVDENSCELRVEIHFKGSFIKETMIRVGMKNVLKSSFKKFKKLCEKGIFSKAVAQTKPELIKFTS